MHLVEDQPSNNSEKGTPHYQTLRQQLPEAIAIHGYPCLQPSNRLFQLEYSLSDRAGSSPRWAPWLRVQSPPTRFSSVVLLDLLGKIWNQLSRPLRQQPLPVQVVIELERVFQCIPANYR